ncbi:MAG TPA: DNA ligase D [Bacteroidia bacterium]|nr:DNA ligase D [Bacteroidia bacterium]
MKRYLPGKSRKLSNYIRPMLAKETDQPFDDSDWIFEIKWDGYRAIAELDKEQVKLYSRNGNMFNDSYPQITEQLKKMNLHAVIDGEIVALDKEGKPSFQLLQDFENNASPLVYYVFDVLSLNGKNTCNLPLLERKALLKKLLKKNDTIRFADHVAEDGKSFFKLVLKKDLEGMMAKKADSAYYPGRRTNEWLKIKQHKTAEAVIAGFTEPQGGRKYFGALVLGVMDGKKLKYIGHTGSGFNHRTLVETYDLLKPLIRKESPFDVPVKTNMPVTWVKPELVCELKFTEWTKDGSMRHPIFLHLRPDKDKKEVKKEPAPVAPVANKKSAPVKTREDINVVASGRVEVPLTHLDKVFWPEEGVTKGDVIRYYQEINEIILPYLKDRPESLKRNPNGISDKGFYQKDAGDQAPDWVKSISIHSESGNKDVDYILCGDKATLAYLNNLGCIELNPWHSTIKSLDHPDYLIIDIDPSAKNTFDQVIEVAQIVREILEKAKAPGFCKTSGATGMHIYVPTGRKYTYDQLKDFAHLICVMAADRLPRFTTLERNLRKRGEKHIYLDHLQNRKGQTIASAYSLRPYPGATVSTPLAWKEVKPGLDPSAFNIHTTPARLKKTGDLFSGVLGKGFDLARCLKLLDK